MTTAKKTAAAKAADTPEDVEIVEVVVRPKRSVKHDGKHHGETVVLTLPQADAERLKALGFVDYYDDLKAIAQASRGVTLSVGEGVSVTQTD